MRIVDAKATLLSHDSDALGFIEKVGRTCYKSEDKITQDSKVQFVKNLINRRHFAMLEHEHIYFSVCEQEYGKFIDIIDTMDDLPDFPIGNGRYFNLGSYYNAEGDNEESAFIISGSFRSFIEFFEKFNSYPAESKDTFFKNDLQELIWNMENDAKTCYPVVFEDIDLGNNTHTLIDGIELMDRKEFIQFCDDHPFVKRENHLTHSVHFVCDRGVSHELVRHRPASFAQESTRYCNYSKGKSDSQITVIKPFFYMDENRNEEYDTWVNLCKVAEAAYMTLMNEGSVAQEARSVLPNSLKTEIIVTAVETEWQHIINLRYHGTTGAPHPQMKEVMSQAYEQFMNDPSVTTLK